MKKIVTHAIDELRKWERQISDADEGVTQTLSLQQLRKMAGQMAALRLELQDTDARETRPDPGVRRRKAR